MVTPFYDESGRLTAKFTSMFVRSPQESGSASAGRFLLAIDILTASALTPDQLADASRPLELRRYLEALKRRSADRAVLLERLSKLGMRLCRIPSLSDGELSVNYLNGLHTPSAYLMPVFGGFCGELDQAAGRAMSDAFGGGVRIEPIRSAHAQMGYGGVHCMTGLYPKPPTGG